MNDNDEYAYEKKKQKNIRLNRFCVLYNCVILWQVNKTCVDLQNSDWYFGLIPSIIWCACFLRSSLTNLFSSSCQAAHKEDPTSVMGRAWARNQGLATDPTVHVNNMVNGYAGREKLHMRILIICMCVPVWFIHDQLCPLLNDQLCPLLIVCLYIFLAICIVPMMLSLCL